LLDLKFRDPDTKATKSAAKRIKRNILLRIFKLYYEYYGIFGMSPILSSVQLMRFVTLSSSQLFFRYELQELLFKYELQLEEVTHIGLVALASFSLYVVYVN
jgi:hypothetical protein